MSAPIRRATPDDAEDIHQVMQAAFASFEPQYTPECFDATVLDAARIVQRMEDGPVWVAEVAGQVVGTVGAVRDGRGLYVRGMGVHPDARRQGVGQRLLQACEAYARETESACMWLSTTPFLSSSIALYQAFGFVEAAGPPDLHGTPLRSFEKSLT